MGRGSCRNVFPFNSSGKEKKIICGSESMCHFLCISYVFIEMHVCTTAHAWESAQGDKSGKIIVYNGSEPGAFNIPQPRR